MKNPLMPAEVALRGIADEIDRAALAAGAGRFEERQTPYERTLRKAITKGRAKPAFMHLTLAFGALRRGADLEAVEAPAHRFLGAVRAAAMVRDRAPVLTLDQAQDEEEPIDREMDHLQWMVARGDRSTPTLLRLRQLAVKERERCEAIVGSIDMTINGRQVLAAAVA